MQRKLIAYNTKEEWLNLRKPNINSTEISAIFGLSPYMTKRQVWDNKKNETEIVIEENSRMMFGKLLEPVILEAFAKITNKNVMPFKDYGVIPDLRIGGSFDGIVTDEDAIIEIKNVDGWVFKKDWTDNEAPPAIELQVQHQLLVSGKSKCYIAALVGGNDLKIFEREVDNDIQNQIINACKDFWVSIENNNPPDYNFAQDADYIKSIYNKDDGSIIETDEFFALASRYKDFSTMEAEAKEQKEAVKAELLTKIGSASKVKGSRYSISATMVNKGEYTVKPSSYRTFKVTVKDN